ncbi:MAG: ribosome small subunit-dependent GTPase A [Clostridiaceae bacterium]|jgi:ribosome biogenesis GTPase|nr:ribosome small subunit-dependent GTPase A [Clostridiaceae bacterium]
MPEGKVVRAVTSKFVVDDGKKTYLCTARKKLKQGDGDIFVGDNVEFSFYGGSGVIEEIKPRKNVLVRPYVANVDVCIIVLAPEPEPDYLLADKIILNCLTAGIEPVVLANKSDLKELDLTGFAAIAETKKCSALTGEGVYELFAPYAGKIISLAGQSAAGKSALINAAAAVDIAATGVLSKRINRGKHTTRQTELYKIAGAYIIDTCGFSMLEIPDIEPETLFAYYDDMVALSDSCKYKGRCTHRLEPDCAVIAAVESGSFDKGRYSRYLEMYAQLEERRKNKY